MILDDLMLHIAPDKVDELGSVFPVAGSYRAAPRGRGGPWWRPTWWSTKADLWAARLDDLRAVGAAGHRALPTDAIVD